MYTYTLRLKPDEDLRTAVERFVTDHSVEAGCIVTCVGSLKTARLRLADASIKKTFQGPFEVVSLVGTLGLQGVHLHISLADHEGKMIGGHLTSGCPIYTTAEIIIGVIPGQRFLRQLDLATGYKELVAEATD